MRLELAIKSLPRDEKVAIAASTQKLASIARAVATKARKAEAKATRPLSGRVR